MGWAWSDIRKKPTASFSLVLWISSLHLTCMMGERRGPQGHNKACPVGLQSPHSQKSSCLVAGRWGHPHLLYCPVNLATAGLALIALVFTPGQGRAGITLTCVSRWGWQSWAQYPCVAPAAARISLSVPRLRRGFFLSLSLSFLFGGLACGILVPRPGIEPGPPAVEVWRPNHWTSREVLRRGIFFLVLHIPWASEYLQRRSSFQHFQAITDCCLCEIQ